LLDGVDDLLPDAGAAPATIAAIDGLPGTEVRWEISPGGTGSSDPEHAADNAAMIEQGTADDRLLRWEQWRDSRPLLVGQFKVYRLKNVHLWAVEKDCGLSCSASGMAGLGNGSMAAPEGRPRQAEGEAVRWLDQRKEEASHLWEGQREEISGPPFSAPFAVRRVTSREACARSPNVMWRYQAIHLRTSY